jgi:lipid-A-disaccharide synthase
MKFYIIAGEASGDMYGAKVIEAIRVKSPDAVFRCWGGDLMQKAGGNVIKHYRELAFMGFFEVFANLRTILSNLSACKKDILEYKPDAVILIDYPGFNLRIAEFAHQNKIKVCYYIAPQIWAWKESRIKKIKKNINRLFVILPFEEEFYKKYDYKVYYFGHPLPDIIEEVKCDKATFLKKNNLSEKPIITLLPGSRKQEVIRILPIMLSVIPDFPEYQFVIGGAASLPKSIYEPYLLSNKVSLLYNQTYDLLRFSHTAIVKSGTSALETALMGIPQVVCYKANKISYLIAKRLIKVKFISLPNLIMDKKVVTELIQDDFNTTNLKSELNKLIYDNEYRESIKNEYKKIKAKLGNSGVSSRIADEIIRFVS